MYTRDYSRNITLLTDFYQLTMMGGYFRLGKANQIAVFDMFYRKNPDGAAYSIAAGLEQVIEYIKNIKFSDDDIDYLRANSEFSEDYLKFLRNFKFTGDIYAMPEGTVVLPNEPLLRIKAPIIQAQFIETTILNIINHQSLIATKASRVCFAAKGDNVMEFGIRRAQGPDAALYGTRAAIIGGCTSTANVLAGKIFGVPVVGTHAHSWVMSFDDELTAFRAYAETYPKNCLLLVDTYDTLRSGIPNAIIVFNELKAKGINGRIGIRLDSGDLAYLSIEARKMLDAAGFSNAIICASNDLDEYTIESLKLQNAKIKLWGVGTNLITSASCPAFGGVYKLVAIEKDGTFESKIKLSDNIEKIINPGYKEIYRVYSPAGRIKADLLALHDEIIDENKTLKLVDPRDTWKQTKIKAGNYNIRKMLVPIFINGECVYQSPTIKDISTYCKDELATLWDESRRLKNPHSIPVDLTDKLYDLKKQLIYEMRDKKLEHEAE